MQLLNMVYDVIGVDKQIQLILKCRYPIGVKKFQPLLNNDCIVARMLAMSSKNVGLEMLVEPITRSKTKKL